jgi:DNA-directed RNA polymerase subunit RPC12/RpoP
MEGGEVVDNLCPDCLECDERVEMDRKEYAVEWYWLMRCPVCGYERLEEKDIE